MKVVSVINYKGGVGKMTLTANLGAYAASQGKRVLLIDLDPQTHLTYNFMTPDYWGENYAETRTLKNYFAPIVSGREQLLPLSELIIPLKMGDELGISGIKLDIISSNLGLADIDIKLSGLRNATNREIWASSSLKVFSYLRESLFPLRDDYDLVLIDCPPNFNAMVRNAITASDYYIVPSRLDYLSTLGVKHVKKNIEDYLDEYSEYRKTVQDIKYRPIFLLMLGIVPMMVNVLRGDEMISVQQEYLRKLKESGYVIFHYVRNNGSLFGAFPEGGIPVVMRRPRINLAARRVVRELQELGDEFISKVYRNLDVKRVKTSRGFQISIR